MECLPAHMPVDKLGERNLGLEGRVETSTDTDQHFEICNGFIDFGKNPTRTF
jgi:hypothetical protein